ncbi:MAG: hypothetical protein D6816_02475 [Bacteroidetes bacterium]|nr:MAG: hypothetical protein D6816_02475 [Bacteroidota bacterium]
MKHMTPNFDVPTSLLVVSAALVVGVIICLFVLDYIIEHQEIQNQERNITQRKTKYTKYNYKPPKQNN